MTSVLAASGPRHGPGVQGPHRLPVVAMDGPAGAGKSTLARTVASRAGILYVDTGAMYRAVALAVLRTGGEGMARGAIEDLAHNVEIDLRAEPDGLGVYLDGEDVREAIRRPDVERSVPVVARLPGVRAALVPRQRALAMRGGAVLDGRDIGTVVVPWADCKFFVTAAFDVRVDRRFRQLRRSGAEVDLETVASDVRRRDALDEERTTPADDAVRIDTTHIGVEEAAGIVFAACPCLRSAAARAGKIGRQAASWQAVER